jgi:hypothetical protein
MKYEMTLFWDVAPCSLAIFMGTNKLYSISLIIKKQQLSEKPELEIYRSHHGFNIYHHEMFLILYLKHILYITNFFASIVLTPTRPNTKKYKAPEFRSILCTLNIHHFELVHVTITWWQKQKPKPVVQKKCKCSVV